MGSVSSGTQNGLSWELIDNRDSQKDLHLNKTARDVSALHTLLRSGELCLYPGPHPFPGPQQRRGPGSCTPPSPDSLPSKLHFRIQGLPAPEQALHTLGPHASKWEICKHVSLLPGSFCPQSVDFLQISSQKAEACRLRAMGTQLVYLSFFSCAGWSLGR